MTTLPRSDLTDGAGSLSEAASPGTSELTRFTPAGSSPDVAAIARMANAFYAGTPSNPFPGPGAALPSAPVFSAEPIYNSLPGTPALQPPLSPNLNPGLPPMPIPASGAAQPSAPVFSIEPMLGQAQSSPAPSFIQPQGGKGASAGPIVPPVPTPSSPIPLSGAPSAPAPQGIPSDADLAMLPFSLGGVMSLIPSFEDTPSPYGQSGLGGLSGPAMGSATPGETYSFLDRSTAPAYDPAPRAGNGATPGAAGAAPRNGVSGSSLPFAYGVSVLDLSGLNFQHQPGLGAPATGITGVRPFDPYAIKRDFPILQQNVNGRPLVWLDNGATTQKPQSVIDRISYFYENENSNIHRGAHTLAARSTDAYEGARARVRGFINAPTPESIIFVRGTTEGINLIAKAWGGRNVNEGDEIVITHLEHHANIVPWQQLAAEKGAVLKVAPVDNTGQIILEEYEKLFTPRTRLASMSQVSNALGTITPIAEMVAIAHRHGAIAIVDGAQSVSHMPIDVQALDADFFVFSGHKMFAPTGIGAVYGRPSILESMPPWQGGGNMIQDVTFEKTTFHGPPGRFEAGTGNIADAVGLGAAIDYLSTIGMSNIAAYEHELLGYLTQGLLSVPGLRLIGTAHEKAGVASFVLDECRSEDVGKALAQEGIAVRAGHHCAQPILRRFGLEATVRPSLALYNTTDDVDTLVAALLRIQTGRGKRLA
jgi:cysteine desulfurase / selenocysteine lyase